MYCTQRHCVVPAHYTHLVYGVDQSQEHYLRSGVRAEELVEELLNIGRAQVEGQFETNGLKAASFQVVETGALSTRGFKLMCSTCRLRGNLKPMA